MPSITRHAETQETHFNAFSVISDMTDEVFTSLVTAFEKTQPILNPNFLALKIAEEVKALTTEQLSDITTTIISLISVLLRNKVPVDNLIVFILNNLPLGDDDRFKNFQAKEEAFKHKLNILLSINNLHLLAKAIDLMREYDNIFSNARVVSDIRPIFDFGVDDTDPALVGIVHNLKLTYLNNGQLKEFFLALDDSDLQVLTKSLSRATQKAEKLREIANKTNLKLISVE